MSGRYLGRLQVDRPIYGPIHHPGGTIRQRCRNGILMLIWFYEASTSVEGSTGGQSFTINPELRWCYTFVDELLSCLLEQVRG